jgi:hypothetical protein
MTKTKEELESVADHFRGFEERLEARIRKREKRPTAARGGQRTTRKQKRIESGLKQVENDINRVLSRLFNK